MRQRERIIRKEIMNKVYLLKKNVCKILFKKGDNLQILELSLISCICTYMKDNNDTEYEKHLLNIRNTL